MGCSLNPDERFRSAGAVKIQTLSIRPVWLLMLLALCALVTAGTPAIASERWETLEAIHWVENPRNSTKAGPCGELGAYQFREATWRMHTQVSFSRAIERAHSDAVAIKHYEWIKRGLTRAGMETTPYNIALAWNGGLPAVLHGKLRSVTRDYAERVSNIATELSQTRLAQNTAR